MQVSADAREVYAYIVDSKDSSETFVDIATLENIYAIRSDCASSAFSNTDREALLKRLTSDSVRRELSKVSCHTPTSDPGNNTVSVRLSNNDACAVKAGSKALIVEAYFDSGRRSQKTVFSPDRFTPSCN